LHTPFISSYTLLIGECPFVSTCRETIYTKIVNNDYSFPKDVPISDSAKDLITKILRPDPLLRPTLDQILEHPFINHGGTIPKTLPVSTLTCPPSVSYINDLVADKKNLNTRTAEIPSEICKLHSDPTPSKQKISIPQSAKCEVYVETWADYSKSYGFGYKLSNGAFGVHFNDL
jgi:polo-like kinase 1